MLRRWAGSVRVPATPTPTDYAPAAVGRHRAAGTAQEAAVPEGRGGVAATGVGMPDAEGVEPDVEFQPPGVGPLDRERERLVERLRAAGPGS